MKGGVQSTNMNNITLSLEPEKKKSRKNVRDSNLYLEDNIMSFECEGNDP